MTPVWPLLCPHCGRILDDTLDDLPFTPQFDPVPCGGCGKEVIFDWDHTYNDETGDELWFAIDVFSKEES